MLSGRSSAVWASPERSGAWSRVFACHRTGGPPAAAAPQERPAARSPQRLMDQGAVVAALNAQAAAAEARLAAIEGKLAAGAGGLPAATVSDLQELRGLLLQAKAEGDALRAERDQAMKAAAVAAAEVAKLNYRLSDAEVLRGFGAYYDSACVTTGGSWAVYSFPGGQRGAHGSARAAADACCSLRCADLRRRPQTYYEAVYGSPVLVVPLASVVNNTRCPYTVPPGGDMSLPSWLYNPTTDSCYFKSSFAKTIAGSQSDATTRCRDRHDNSTLIKITSAAEDEWVRLNLLWTGFFGESYTGLFKAATSSPAFDGTWRWADGSPLLATDYMRWNFDGTAGFNYTSPTDSCMEYLPQQPKTWNAFSCAVNKQYICEKRALQPGEVYTPPAGTSPAPAPTPSPAPAGNTTCSPPAAPAGAVATVVRINAGGPALCGMAADTATSPAGTGGVAENWVSPSTPACAGCATTTTLACLACTVRFGGAFSYAVPATPGRAYRVRLTFSEVWWTSAGSRRVNVAVNGQAVDTGVDPYALAGAKFVAARREYNVTQGAGSATMTVALTVGLDNAILAALEVYDMGVAAVPSPGPALPSPSPQPVTSPAPTVPSPAPVATPSPTPLPSPSPLPTVPGLPAACSTPQPPQNAPCPAMLSDAEVLRGFGAYYDSTCVTTGGSWAVYSFPGGQRGAHGSARAAADACCSLRCADLRRRPQTYYEAVYGSPVLVVPLASVVNNTRCPYTVPPGGDMSLPSWLYNPTTDSCYFKSSFAKTIAGSQSDATTRCRDRHDNSTLIKITSAAEDEWVRLNLLWTGFFGESYTGLFKAATSSPAFDGTWRWADGSPLLATDYMRWNFDGTAGFNYTSPTDSCMEYLPQQPKTWNAFSCAVNKQYICEKRALQPGEVYTPPAGTSPAPAPTPSPAPAGNTTCSPPAAPAGAVATVVRINAGGPALCGMAADTATSPAGTGGVAENWVSPSTPACAGCATTTTLACLACTVRFGGAFSYAVPATPGRAYRVRLTFSEVWWTSAGSRRVNVAVNGQAVDTGVDPYALAGAKFVAARREYNVTQGAGSATMTVALTVGLDNAILAALEVYDMGVA
ncbi:hypothetical protein HT031_001669 [Scenedesmus sp. PABB004]|nr:hypothetical protein HT031_001669 [Scenedesmus sp. PABB004]